MTLQSACVFCGSSSNVDEAYKQAAQEMGDGLAKRGVRLVYGGGKVGLMGIAADACLSGGGEVLGVIPEFLQSLEVGHGVVTELIVTQSMHERKAIMYERSDAFVILPGGLGTLDEMMEALTWRQLQLSDKPIIIANINGYWDEALALMEKVITSGFARESARGLFTVAATVDEVLEMLDRVETGAPSSPEESRKL